MPLVPSQALPLHIKELRFCWDKFGVAHVFAKSTPDLFYGYGWATAQSHGNLLMKLYGESRGRAAEYFGPTGVANDRWVWTNSVPQRSATWLDAQTPEFRSYMEAFAKGINDYAAINPNAFSEQAKRVLPVSALSIQSNISTASSLFALCRAFARLAVHRSRGARD